MANVKKKRVQYFELRTSIGSTILIRDDRVSSNTPGRLNLYNTDKKAFTQYDETIVSTKLTRLNEAGTKAAILKYDIDWKTARAEYLQKNKKLYNLSTKSNIVTDSNLDTNDDADDIADELFG